jgi:ABC-type sugar transport system permease subunit
MRRPRVDSIAPDHGRGNPIRGILRNPQWLVAAVCAVCFVGPALMVALGSFKVSAFQGGEWSSAMFGEVLTSERTRDVVVQTVAMGLAVVVISTVLAAVFAAIYTKTDTPMRGAIPIIMFVVVATLGCSSPSHGDCWGISRSDWSTRSSARSSATVRGW